jgi:hypothetical protein
MEIDGINLGTAMADGPVVGHLVTVRRRQSGATQLRLYTLMRGGAMACTEDRFVPAGGLTEAILEDFMASALSDLRLTIVTTLGAQQDLLG